MKCAACHYEHIHNTLGDKKFLELEVYTEEVACDFKYVEDNRRRYLTYLYICPVCGTVKMDL